MRNSKKWVKTLALLNTLCYNIKAFWDSIYAGVVKLADTLDLGSSSSECRFNSCHPHHLKTLYRGSCGVAVYHACLSRRRSRVRFPSGPPLCAHVVQLDRILDYGSRGCGFESCHARHLILIIKTTSGLSSAW